MKSSQSLVSNRQLAYSLFPQTLKNFQSLLLMQLSADGKQPIATIDFLSLLNSELCIEQIILTRIPIC